MSDTLSEKVSSDVSSDATSLSQQFQDQLESILRKLKTDPSSITAEEARTLSENVAICDDRAAFSHAQTPHGSLLMAAKDLHAAVDGSAEEATTEVFRVAQSIVSKLQKTVGHTNAPHPEVEAELQEEITKIEPKIAQGTVIKAEADHIHSLEARAHGHTKKGGIAAAAQSITARSERQLSLSSGSESNSSPIRGRPHANSRNIASSQQNSRQERLNEFHHAEMAVRPKVEGGTTAKPETNHLHSLEVRTNGDTEKSVASVRRVSNASSGGPRANSKSAHSRSQHYLLYEQEYLRNVETAIELQTENDTATQVDANTLREMRAYDHTENGGLSATAQPFVSHRRQESLTDVSISSMTEHHRQQSQHIKDLNKVDEDLEEDENETQVKTLVQDG